MPFWESQPSLTFIQWILRAIIIFFWLFFLTKIMGQRMLGRLHAFDLMVIIAVAGTSAGAIHSSQNSLIAIIVTTGMIAVLYILFSYLSLKFAKFRRVFQDEPLVGYSKRQLNRENDA